MKDSRSCPISRLRTQERPRRGDRLNQDVSSSQTGFGRLHVLFLVLRFFNNEVAVQVTQAVVYCLATIGSQLPNSTDSDCSERIAKTVGLRKGRPRRLSPRLGIPSTAIAINIAHALSQRRRALRHRSPSTTPDPRTRRQEPSLTTTSPARRSTRFPSTFISTLPAHLHLDSRDQT